MIGGERRQAVYAPVTCSSIDVAIIIVSIVSSSSSSSSSSIMNIEAVSQGSLFLRGWESRVLVAVIASCRRHSVFWLFAKCMCVCVSFLRYCLLMVGVFLFLWFSPLPVLQQVIAFQMNCYSR